jgi:hypothetical protein
MNRSAKGGARSSLHYGGEGVLIHPPHQGVCGRHGTEEQRVTSGELPGSAGGTAGSKPISASEVVSGALAVVGRLSSTEKHGESRVTEYRRSEWIGEGSR